MQSSEIRNRFLKFFEKRGHAIIPSASLVPENDPSVLFTTAGMHPLISYLLGQPHPMGNRLVSIQKCVRTQDIEEIGDKTHDTFFEMLGNWSLGDYFKKDAIEWSYELLTNKESGFGLDPNRLYVTCFEGNEDAPKDEESASIWREIFDGNNIKGNRIFFLPAKNNWWSPGDNGPCGPDTEMFYDLTGKYTEGLSFEEYISADDKQEVVEIWNDVFMEYEKKDGKVIGKLKKQNVDTGAGLERLTMALQQKDNIFETDLFSSIMDKINQYSKNDNTRAKRIVADHIRTASFMINDNVIPSNTHRGYILRRILRRAVRYADILGFDNNVLHSISELVVEKYTDVYPDLKENKEKIQKEIQKEEEKFRETLEKGTKEFEKGCDPFVLFTTYGFPIELTQELAKEKGIEIDLEDFKNKMTEHQKLSQTSSAGMFKGGLANHNDATIKLHTVHHLLLAGLQKFLGKEVKQRGSNITEERLRIDFSFDRKLTDEEKKNIEDWVNEKIKEGLPMTRVEIKREEAERLGAEMEFGAKYPEMVSVYYIGDNLENAISKEFCGGPHIQNTKELSTFKIQKEEAVAQGVRRIKAVLV